MWFFRLPTWGNFSASAATAACTLLGPLLWQGDKASDGTHTHIIYTFERATCRHVEFFFSLFQFATHLRLAFYEFISVHLRLMCQPARWKAPVSGGSN